MKTWVIQDWTGAVKFAGREFKSFEDAEEFLSRKLGDDYDTDRQEFEIVETPGSRCKSVDTWLPIS